MFCHFKIFLIIQMDISEFFHFPKMLLCPGLGFALCYTPAIAMVGCYFQQRKALAYGIAMSGSGIGTFVLAPAVQELIELYSWRGALLVLSAVVGNLCVCGALLRPITLLENEGMEEEVESSQEEKHGEKLYMWQLVLHFSTQWLLSVAHKHEKTPEHDDLVTRKQLRVHAIVFTLSSHAGILSQEGDIAVKLSKESEDRLLESGHLPSPTAPQLPGNPTPPLQKRRCLSPYFLSSKEYRFLLLPDFLGLAVSFLFLASGCSLPFVYLVPYALSVTVSHQQAAFLMSILGITDIVGNITFGWLTDRRYDAELIVSVTQLYGLCLDLDLQCYVFQNSRKLPAVDKTVNYC